MSEQTSPGVDFQRHYNNATVTQQSHLHNGYKVLLPFLETVSKSSNLRNFSGFVAAVDVSCWLHKAVAISFIGADQPGRSKAR